MQACAKARAVVGDVLAVEEAVDLLPEQPFQLLLALDYRQLRGANAIKEQEIEGQEDELVGAPFIHRCLEPAEHRQAVAFDGAELAVDITGFDREPLQGLDHAPVSVRPVQAGARQQRGFAAVDAGVHAVAVVLDLVQPAVA